MMLGLIQKFGTLSVMLGIAWPLSRMQIWGAEGCTGMYTYSVPSQLQPPFPWSVLEEQ